MNIDDTKYRRRLDSVLEDMYVDREFKRRADSIRQKAGKPTMVAMAIGGGLGYLLGDDVGMALGITVLGGATYFFAKLGIVYETGKEIREDLHR